MSRHPRSLLPVLVSLLIVCLLSAPVLAWTGPDIDITSPESGGVLGSNTFEVTGTASNGSAATWMEDWGNGFSQGELDNTTLSMGSIQLATQPLEGLFGGAARPGSSTGYIWYWRTNPPSDTTVTFELFIRYAVVPDNNTLVFEGYDNTAGGRESTIRLLFSTDNNTLRFDYYTMPGSVWYSLFAPIPTVDQWHHVACQAGVGGAKFFVDGNLESNNSVDRTVSDIDGAALGGGVSQNNPMETAMVTVDEFRISSVQRYTADFTPPNATFSSDANTLLLEHMDGTTSGFNRGWIFTGLVDEGSFVSRPFDATISVVHLDRGMVGADAPNGTNVSLFVRWSPNANMSGSSDWSSIDPLGTIQLPPADRFLQYRLDLNQTVDITPAVYNVSIYYRGITGVEVSTDGTTWVAANGTEQWRANVTAEGEGIVTVYVAAYDVAGNVTIAAVTAVLDLTPPSGTMTLAGGAAFTSAPVVPVRVVASDNNPVTHMLVSEDQSFSGASWQPFRQAFDLTLSAGDGEKTVYMKVRDIAGHESTPMSDSVVLDTTPPNGTMTVGDGSGTTLSASVVVSLDATDANGVTEARLGTASDIDAQPWVPFKTSFLFGLDATEGVHTIVADVRDVAGNVLRLSDEVLLDLTPPTVSVQLAEGAELVDEGVVQARIVASDTNGLTSMRYATSADGLDAATWVAFASTVQVTAAEDGTLGIWVAVRDAAGRTSVATDTVVVDTTAPSGSIAIDGGAAWVHGNDVTLQLEAADATSGVAYIRVSNTDAFTGAQQLEPATSMDWALQGGDGERTVYYEIVDVAGHRTVLSAMIVVDTVPPTGTISLPVEVSDNREVEVDLTWEGAVDMWLSEDPDADGPWVPVEDSRSFTLSAGDGVKTVHVRFRGMYGLMSDVLDATVTLDTTAPTLLITSPAPDTEVRTRQVTVAGTASDANGVVSVMVNVDGSSEWVNIPAQAQWSTVVDLGDWGTHTITVRVKDSAGNSAEASTLVDAKEEETFISSGGSLAIVLAVLIVCVTVIVLGWMMMRRREPPLEEP